MATSAAHTRRLIAGISAVAVAGGPILLVAQASQAVEIDALLIGLALVGAFPCVLFLTLVRSHRGSVVGGAALLLASTLPSLGLLVWGFDDGLEIFSIPVFAWLGGLTAIAIDTSARSPRA